MTRSSESAKPSSEGVTSDGQEVSKRRGQYPPSTAGYYRRAMEEYTILQIRHIKWNKLTSLEI